MCGERLAAFAVTSSENRQSTLPAALPPIPKSSTATPLAQQPPAATPAESSRNTPPSDTEPIPEWLERLYKTSADKTLPIKARLLPTHELLRMANAIGIDVDYSTLRFWQKRGLVPSPVRGPVGAGRGTRGYYDPSLIDRLGFIRETQKTYVMGLDTIREELERIDQQNAQSGGEHPQRLYQQRLNELQVQHNTEARRTLLAVVCGVLGLDPGEIVTILVHKADGQTIRFQTDNAWTEFEKQTVEETGGRGDRGAVTRFD
jgi:DNA-binding transcriptional MerR regulator